MGFEPTKPVRVPVFETGAIVHYATSPEKIKKSKFKSQNLKYVHPAGIEPALVVPQTTVLSIKLWVHGMARIEVILS